MTSARLTTVHTFSAWDPTSNGQTLSPQTDDQRRSEIIESKSFSGALTLWRQPRGDHTPKPRPCRQGEFACATASHKVAACAFRIFQPSTCPMKRAPTS